jgi:hypothetical protein
MLEQQFPNQKRGDKKKENGHEPSFFGTIKLVILSP